MSNPNPKLRNALGISALTAFSLVMIGCGGSSSSAPTASNAAPGSVTISGANTAVTAHSSIYNLSAVDPEGDAITFSTTTAGATISGSVLTFTPPLWPLLPRLRSSRSSRRTPREPLLPPRPLRWS
ncbi:MAG: hypothetical protein IPP78_06980 [Holophagaceae bacterium]|nr:hypothetical protein [Holophagaceae bacterium]